MKKNKGRKFVPFLLWCQKTPHTPLLACLPDRQWINKGNLALSFFIGPG